MPGFRVNFGSDLSIIMLTNVSVELSNSMRCISILIKDFCGLETFFGLFSFMWLLLLYVYVNLCVDTVVYHHPYCSTPERMDNDEVEPAESIIESV